MSAAFHRVRRLPMRIGVGSWPLSARRQTVRTETDRASATSRTVSNCSIMNELLRETLGELPPRVLLLWSSWDDKPSIGGIVGRQVKACLQHGQDSEHAEGNATDNRLLVLGELAHGEVEAQGADGAFQFGNGLLVGSCGLQR